MMMQEPEHKKNWDFSQIDELVYFGADLCCGADHYGYLVATIGIKATINLRAEEMFRPPNILEHYLWLPVEDMTAPSKSQLMVGARAIEELVKEGKRVFVHCTNGHGRAPTLVAAYYIITQGMTAEEALAKIRESRPESHPNKAQMEALRELEGTK